MRSMCASARSILPLLLIACGGGGDPTGLSPDQAPTPPPPTTTQPNAAITGTYVVNAIGAQGGLPPCNPADPAGCPLVVTNGKTAMLKSGEVVLRTNGTTTLVITATVNGALQQIANLAGTYTAVEHNVTLTLGGAGVAQGGWVTKGDVLSFILPPSVLGTSTVVVIYAKKR
jgi:hypothetical protein